MNTATLLTTNALLSIVASSVMFVVLRTRKTYPGFGFWVAGILCLALGAGMLVPGILPDSWLIRVSRNALLVGGLVLLLRGMLVFRGHRVTYWLEALIALSFLATFGYFSLDSGALDARIVTYCIYAGALSLATVFVILYRRPADFGSNDVVLAVFLSLNGLFALIRAEQQLALPFGTAFEASQGFGVFYAMVQILVVQMATLTLISINSQRIEWHYRTSEARLREGEERLRAIGDNLPDGFVFRYELLDGKPRFDYISAGIEKTLGLTPLEAMADAQRFFALLTPESRAQFQADEAVSAGQLSTYSGTLLFAQPDASPRWLHLQASPYRRPDGAVVWDGVAVDITQRKADEEKIREFNTSLERIVHERTAELTAANQELDAFAYAVSHDLRAPLRAMSGFAQALTEDYGAALTAEAHSYLEQINIASRKMGELIEGILVLSRITRGELRRDVVDISALATRRLEESMRAEPGRQVAVDIAPRLVARGDARMIEAALDNLLGNAWKYTGHAAAPAIRVYGEDRAGKHWTCIADNGAGFDMAHADRLFKPFQRLHRQDEFPGIGIGLATVQRIVHRHGGEIAATGVPGQGATFCFTLPDDPSKEPTS